MTISRGPDTDPPVSPRPAPSPAAPGSCTPRGTTMPFPESVPSIVDVELHRGARAGDAPPSLLLEVPHGATRTEDFTAVAEGLRSPLPDGLVDFFHVNTDAGAPELADAVARRFVEAHPDRSAAVLRCRIPRTFIDCNRRIDASADDFKAGKVTPGLMPWVTDPADRALLRGRYDQYVAAVRAATAAVMPVGGLVMMHTYAPRDVDVEVDADIVRNLRRAYEPEVFPTWPLRPEIDVIGRDLEKRSYVSPALLDALHQGFARAGITLGEGATYPLHPSTLAYDAAVRWPARTLCIEVRRDLVADPFEPFAQMRIGGANVDRIAAPLAAALDAWWPRTA